MEIKELTISEVAKRIRLVRGFQVVLDTDLSHFYQTKTKILNQAVKRNLEQFPEDFRFRLTSYEYSQWNPSEKSEMNGYGGRRYLPYAYTQGGVATLALVLNTSRAFQVQTLLMRAFVQVRASEPHLEVMKRLDSLDCQIKNIQQHLMNLTTLHSAPSRSFEKTSLVRLNSGSRSLENSASAHIELILDTVANYYSLKKPRLLAKTREKSVAVPRQIAAYLIRKNTETSFTEIGRILGKKDHTTVLHACQKTEKEIESNPKICEAVRAIQAAVQQRFSPLN